MTPKIIPTELKNKIRKAARREAASLWDIADLAHEVMEHVNKERAQDKLEGVYDFQIWAAIGALCAKSANRVRKLASISQAFPSQRREAYTERWDFGYFERAFDIGAPVPDPQTGEIGKDERIQAIEFLDDYANGDLSEGIPHDPTVGDFIPMYRQHILGMATEEGGVENIPIFDISISAEPHVPNPLENLRDALNQAYAYLVTHEPVSDEILSAINDLDKLLIKASSETLVIKT